MRFFSNPPSDVVFRHRWKIVPFVVVILLLPALAFQLTTSRDTPALSPLIGKPLPAFSGYTLGGDLRQSGDLFGETSGTVIVNVFASWCVPCLAEHPFLTELAAGNHRIIGIAWNDTPVDTEAWLMQHGNPYTEVLVDTNNRIGIELGVYGVPESLVIRDGVMIWRHVGILTPALIRQSLLPLLL
ncbi:MAG: redoxin family protein [Alphaproteobacteria bacterium]|nr:redoxin family protein [Alphaproteobacteria bacterium]